MFEHHQVQVFIKRDDLTHSHISGNKWRKLKYNLIRAKTLGHTKLLTFGGAYSNHICAIAAVGKLFGFSTVGCIRGEEHLPLNPTLQLAKEQGMEINYIDRTNYHRKNEEDFINSLKEEHGNFYLIPEGGTNEWAIEGVGELIDEIEIQYDTIMCACGTGGTLAGIIKKVSQNKKVVGVPVLKGGHFIREEIEQLIGEGYQFDLALDYHFGGYAKVKPELINFIEKLYQNTGIISDPVYTGKLFFAAKDLIDKELIPKNQKVMIIHTGGIQGLKGFRQKFKDQSLLSYIASI